MRVLLIGSTGVIGSAVAAERHEIVGIGRTGGALHVDITDPASINQLFEQVGAFDALVCAAGAVHYARSNE